MSDLIQCIDPYQMADKLDYRTALTIPIDSVNTIFSGELELSPSICFNIFTIKPDGLIEKGPGFTTDDEASLLFWKNVSNMIPRPIEGHNIAPLLDVIHDLYMALLQADTVVFNRHEPTRVIVQAAIDEARTTLKKFNR